MTIIFIFIAFVTCVYIATNVILLTRTSKPVDTNEGAEALRKLLEEHCKRDIAYIYLEGGRWYAHLAKGNVLVSDLLKNPTL